MYNFSKLEKDKLKSNNNFQGCHFFPRISCKMQRYPLKYRVLLKWEYLIILDENGNNGNCIVISNKIHPNFLHIYYYFKKAFKF